MEFESLCLACSNQVASMWSLWRQSRPTILSSSCYPLLTAPASASRQRVVCSDRLMLWLASCAQECLCVWFHFVCRLLKDAKLWWTCQGKSDGRGWFSRANSSLPMRSTSLVMSGSASVHPTNGTWHDCTPSLFVETQHMNINQQHFWKGICFLQNVCTNLLQYYEAP